jgi:hypothetical protein
MSEPQFDPIGRNQPFTPDQQLLDEAKPVIVTLTAQELGALVAQRCTPEGFKHHLLMKFKEAGVKVEGTIRPKLPHGQIYKMSTELTGPGVFMYVWMPEAYHAGIEAWKLTQVH